MNTSISIPVSESSGAGEARRVAMALAEALHFHSVKAGEVGIVVTELANNLWRHAGEGEILLREIDSPGKTAESPRIRGLEILSIDAGPGMADLEKCLVDGYSSGGSAGIGLGAIARLSSYSEIYSRPNKGTVSLSRIWAETPPKSFVPTAELGAICVPLKGQNVCGDAWVQKTSSSGQQLLLADGLGHGPRAAEAADQAVAVFLEKDLPAKEMIAALHIALKDTVGAVVGLVEITPRGRTFSFIGLGNIAGRIVNDQESKSLISHNGTVGLAVQSIRQADYPWRSHSTLIMHSDGVSGRWDINDYPGLLARHPSVIAGVLFNDFRRERDDASILILREP